MLIWHFCRINLIFFCISLISSFGADAWTYRLDLLCIYQKSWLQSSSTLYIPKKGITEYLYSVYTKKVDYRVAQLCIYQKSELQSRTTLYIPKKWITEYSYSVYTIKGDYRVALLCIYQKSGLQRGSTLYLLCIY